MTSNYRLLDTDVVSYILSAKPERERFVPHLQGHIGAVSFVTLAELLRGAYQKNWGQTRISSMEKHVQENYVVMPYDIAIVRHWALLVSECKRHGVAVAANDAWIAATAVAFGCPLVAGDNAHRQVAKYYPALVVLPDQLRA